jgi:hypothetical protein
MHDKVNSINRGLVICFEARLLTEQVVKQDTAAHACCARINPRQLVNDNTILAFRMQAVSHKT